jgi:opacity protein-like surface antigen
MKIAKILLLSASLALAMSAAYAADTPKSRKSAKEQSASSGATAPRDPEKDKAFHELDLDGDGKVSKAEAAGHAAVTLGFDRADRNKDGKLSFAEYDSIGRLAQKKAKSRQAKAATGSASAGGTAKKD